jgi:hypothetical protein
MVLDGVEDGALGLAEGAVVGGGRLGERGASAAVMNVWVASSSGNADPLARAAHDAAAAPEKPLRCSRSPQLAQPRGAARGRPRASSLSRNASGWRAWRGARVRVEQRELVGEQVEHRRVGVVGVEERPTASAARGRSSALPSPRSRACGATVSALVTVSRSLRPS